MENKNLNLVDILKDCPQGTKLYSTIYGEVKFEEITNNDEYPIKYSYKSNKNYVNNAFVTADGRYSFAGYGECVLFPSKDQRDWSKFKVEPEMIDGEFYTCRFNRDIYIFIYQQHHVYKTKCYIGMNLFTGILLQYCITNNNEAITEIRKATNEDKETLLIGLHRYNFKWDEKKKELIKIEPKFDFSTLKPFDKVLVRDNILQKWKCDLYNYIVVEADFQFRTINNCYKQCIPYNNETKHLVGTTEMPPKKYINWEE